MGNKKRIISLNATWRNYLAKKDVDQEVGLAVALEGTEETKYYYHPDEENIHPALACFGASFDICSFVLRDHLFSCFSGSE